MELTFGFQKELLEFLQKKINTKNTCHMHACMHTCSALKPSPQHLSLSSPYLTPILILIIPSSFPFIKNISLPSAHLRNPALNPSLPKSSIFPPFPILFPPNAPLYLLMEHTQRSPPTNYITWRSANMTSTPRPNHTISKSTTHLLTFL